MKRGTFRQKSYQEKITQLSTKKRPTGLIRGHKGIKKTKVKKLKVYWKPPVWFMAIPTGSHGSNPIQKRLWKLTSDYVRILETEKYGVCASCGKNIGNWQDGDCGHYKAWSVCNNYFKYDQMNLAFQCNNCNRLSDGNVGHNFAETLMRRYGADHLENIEKRNAELHGGKLDDVKLIVIAEDIINHFKYYTIQKPDYYEKVIEKIENKE